MQDDKDTKNITVTIAGRSYPLKVKKSDELTIRQIVKEVNDKVNLFQTTYTKKDTQDCVSLTLLTYAVDMHKLNQTSQSDGTAEGFSNDLSEKAGVLDRLLTEMLEAE